MHAWTQPMSGAAPGLLGEARLASSHHPGSISLLVFYLCLWEGADLEGS